MRKLLALAACLTLLASCSETPEVASGLTIEALATGWRDAGSVQGRNKLVPSASVKIHNASDRTLASVQVNAVFRRVGEPGEWGSAFTTAAGSSGLTPGAEATLMLKSERGYTGEDPVDALLRNRQFVDVTVDVFAKYGSRQWARVATFPIDRQLLR